MEVIQSIQKELDHIKLRRHQLIFIVMDTFKQDLKFASDRLDVPYVNVNLELSAMLKDMPLKKRYRKVTESLKTIIQNKNADTVVLDHIEILFDSQLKQDPMLLFEDMSRNHTLIIGWKGQYDQQKLIYSQPDHHEYYTHNRPEGMIIEF